MKKILSGLIALIIFTQFSFSQKVGKIVNGQPVITANKQQMIQHLQKTIKQEAGISAVYNSVLIKTVGGLYYIVFKGSRYATTLPLELNAGKLLAQKISCTTSDCASNGGCIPHQTQAVCLECRDGDCLKVTTADFQL
jgi:parvulin-like peptidyl-prolyl isomerase